MNLAPLESCQKDLDRLKTEMITLGERLKNLNAEKEEAIKYIQELGYNTDDLGKVVADELIKKSELETSVTTLIAEAKTALNLY